MDLVVIPQAVLMVYGPLVLGCGAVLGFIAARNVGRGRLQRPEPPDDLLERRVRILEEELESARGDLDRLTSENEFMRQLRDPPSPDDGLTEKRRRSAA